MKMALNEFMDNLYNPFNTNIQYDLDEGEELGELEQQDLLFPRQTVKDRSNPLESMREASFRLKATIPKSFNLNIFLLKINFLKAYMFTKFLSQQKEIIWFKENFHFRTIFGFSKNAFKHILDRILPLLVGSDRNQDYLTLVQKLCIFLDFLRTNSFQPVIGSQNHNMVSQGRSCVIINSLASIIASLREEVN